MGVAYLANRWLAQFRVQLIRMETLNRLQAASADSLHRPSTGSALAEPRTPPTDGMSMKSNLVYWQQLQENDYFERHPCYNGLVDMGDEECRAIEWFHAFTGSERVVVIGCGYGRESVHIARRVAHVWGIDVSQRILEKAVQYTHQNGVTNFTPVLAENFSTEIPSDLDLVFSIVVFQHLTRDLARNYLDLLGRKLSPNGKMIIQFCQDFNAVPDGDAELRLYEPNVSYDIRQVVEMARPLGLKLENARSYMATDQALWHWTCLVRSTNAG